jgi:hypothetical protein
MLGVPGRVTMGGSGRIIVAAGNRISIPATAMIALNF